MTRVAGVNVEGRSFSADTTLETVECCTCGILYAIPESLNEYLQKYNREADNNTAWTCCPAGHRWGYVGLNREQKLQRERDQARDAAASERARRDQAEASLKAQRAATSRIRNQRDRERQRASAGVCPGCNRTFKQLARHMASQHPDFPPKGES